MLKDHIFYLQFQVRALVTETSESFDDKFEFGGSTTHQKCQADHTVLPRIQEDHMNRI